MSFTTTDCIRVLDRAFPTLAIRTNEAGNPYVFRHGFEIAVCPTPANKGETMTVNLRTPEAPGMNGDEGAADTVEDTVAIIKGRILPTIRAVARDLAEMAEG